MKKLWVIALVVVLVVLTVYRLRDRDERLIRKAFAELTAAAEVAGKEDMMKGGLRSRAIGNFFVEDVSVDVRGLPMSISSRGELVTLVFNMRTRLDRLAFDVGDVSVTVAPDREHALLTASARIHIRGMGQRDALLKDGEFDWTKTEHDGWRISAIRSVEPIERR